MTSSSDLQARFTTAQEDAKSLPGRPSNDELKELYGLYKQATIGDASSSGVKRPGRLDMVGRAKYDAWVAQQGVAGDAAKEEYIAVVTRLANDH